MFNKYGMHFVSPSNHYLAALKFNLTANQDTVRCGAGRGASSGSGQKMR